MPCDMRRGRDRGRDQDPREAIKHAVVSDNVVQEAWAGPSAGLCCPTQCVCLVLALLSDALRRQGSQPRKDDPQMGLCHP